MSQLIKILSSGEKVIFDQGKFDAWCVFIENTNGKRMAPLDVSYFSDLQKISNSYPKNKVYHDFVKIYRNTTTIINTKTIQLIDEIVNYYNKEDRYLLEKWFSVIYGGMIAEENKTNAILKKRIKRLGMHQVLVEQMNPSLAANYSKGKKWKELDAIMKDKNI